MSIVVEMAQIGRPVHKAGTPVCHIKGLRKVIDVAAQDGQQPVRLRQIGGAGPWYLRAGQTHGVASYPQVVDRNDPRVVERRRADEHRLVTELKAVLAADV